MVRSDGKWMRCDFSGTFPNIVFSNAAYDAVENGIITVRQSGIINFLFINSTCCKLLLLLKVKNVFTEA